MSAFAAPDWADLFAPDRPLADSFVRGTLVYFAVLVVFRVVPRRQVGSVAMADILLLILASEAVSNALNAQSLTLPNGLAALAALVFWNFAVDRAAHRWPWLQKLLEHDPVPLVRDGEPVRETMEAEAITDDELLSQLRQQGVDRVGDVRAAFVEPGGQVSVIKAEAGDRPKPDAPPADSDADPDLDARVAEFVAAARRLQVAAAWHDRRASDHAKAVRAARGLLARHGVRGRAAVAPATDTAVTR
jgi:uncharacterized membrane protein YcaP (DUF421 family)